MPAITTVCLRAEAVRQLTLNTSNLNYCTATINLTAIGIPGFVALTWA